MRASKSTSREEFIGSLGKGAWEREEMITIRSFGAKTRRNRSTHVPDKSTTDSLGSFSAVVPSTTPRETAAALPPASPAEPVAQPWLPKGVPTGGIFNTGIEGSDPLVDGVRRDQLREAGDFYSNYETRLDQIAELGIR